MPGRDPEAAARSSRIGEAIQAEMKRQGLTGQELRKRVEQLRGAPVAERDGARREWVSRRMRGAVNLVTPVKVIYGPTKDLEDIASVLGVKPDRFTRVVNITRKPAPAKTN
jgi:transcriptional regulator with XRE-family HTH domain